MAEGNVWLGCVSEVRREEGGGTMMSLCVILIWLGWDDWIPLSGALGTEIGFC